LEGFAPENLCKALFYSSNQGCQVQKLKKAVLKRPNPKKLKKAK